MKRSHIIATAALVLAVAGFATSRHFSDHSPDISVRERISANSNRC